MVDFNKHPATANPIPAVGVLVHHGRRVLLVRRKNPPNAGKWAVPGGRIHLGESFRDAAEREVHEETGVIVRAGDPVHAFEIIENSEKAVVHYVVVDVIAEYISGEAAAGDDALEAGWFDRDVLASPDLDLNTAVLLARWFDQTSGAG